jgi:hypothetical protein
MKVRCAWCGLDMGEKEPLEDQKVSHSMCEKCQQDTLAEYNASVAQLAECDLGKIEVLSSNLNGGSDA